MTVDAARPKVVDHAVKFRQSDVVNVVHFGVLLIMVVACRLFVFAKRGGRTIKMFEVLWERVDSC